MLLVSLCMVILRAAVDAFSLEADVLGASLAVYGSVALGMMLFPLLGRAHLWLLVHGRVMSLLLTALLLCLCAGSSNWRETVLHAASGSWVVSGDDYQERYNWLWDMGMAYTPLDALSRFGIWAEWRDGPYELTINELLPRVVVRVLPDVALPYLPAPPCGPCTDPISGRLGCFWRGQCAHESAPVGGHRSCAAWPTVPCRFPRCCIA